MGKRLAHEKKKKTIKEKEIERKRGKEDKQVMNKYVRQNPYYHIMKTKQINNGRKKLAIEEIYKRRKSQGNHKTAKINK